MNLLKNKVEGQDSQAMPDEIVDKTWDLPDNESIPLFLRFLKQLMQGKASIIPEIDFYKHEPWDLPGNNPLIYLTLSFLTTHFSLMMHGYVYTINLVLFQ